MEPSSVLSHHKQESPNKNEVYLFPLGWLIGATPVRYEHGCQVLLLRSYRLLIGMLSYTLPRETRTRVQTTVEITCQDYRRANRQGAQELVQARPQGFPHAAPSPVRLLQMVMLVMRAGCARK